ncbi:HD domain-containing phosphohydrolase [Planctomycetota bacterium]
MVQPNAKAGAEHSLRQQLEKLNQVGIALSSERSVDRLFEIILFEARSFTYGEAGTLYVREGDSLRFVVVQNDRLPREKVEASGGLIPITRTSIAGYVASTGQVLNLPDVRDLGSECEFSFNDSYDRSTGYETRSMLVLPMMEPSGHVNGVIQLINARQSSEGPVGAFDSQIERLCLSLASQAAVALRNARLTSELETAYEETIVRLARAAEFRDTDTGEHVQRVAGYSEAIAIEMGVSPEEARRLCLASPMHDVGKLGVPDAILKKPGRLTSDEFDEMKRHADFGADILKGSTISLLQLSEVIALTHHERWDGTGYPRRLKGEDIPLVGRVTAVADVFDALTSKRCYKDPMPLEKACGIIKEGSGTHFDPGVTKAFFKILPKILEIRERYNR